MSSPARDPARVPPLAADPAPGTAEFLVQFTHPDLSLGIPGGPAVVDACAAGALYGADPAAVARIRAAFAARVRDAAEELAADPAVSDALASLPFTENDTIVLYGDSITADLQSWARILAVAAQSRGRRPAAFLNLGRSADTSTHLIDRFGSVAAMHPTHVIVLAGTNDAKAFGHTGGRPLVEPATTRRNVTLLSDGIAGIGASATWILPPPLAPAIAAKCPFWLDQSIQWREEHVARVQQEIRQAAGNAIDLSGRFSSDPAPLLLEDGLHPNLAGHKAIVRAILAHLTQGRATKP